MADDLPRPEPKEIDEKLALQLKHLAAACRLVKPVNILRDDRLHDPVLFQLSQRPVRAVRLCAGVQHLRPVIAVKGHRIPLKEGSA